MIEKELFCGDYVIYNKSENENYVGKITKIDNENKIAYVWYGYCMLASATEISKLKNVDFFEVPLYKCCNRDFLEVLSFINCTFEGEIPYIEAIHNMIKIFNESDYSIKLNELDYQLNLSDYVSFAKYVNEMNKMIIVEEEKRKR